MRVGVCECVRGKGSSVGVWVPVAVKVEYSDTECVWVPVRVVVRVAWAVQEAVGVRVGVRSTLPLAVVESLPDRVTDSVCETTHEADADRDAEAVAVGCGVPVPVAEQVVRVLLLLPLLEPAAVAVVVRGAEPVPVPEPEGVRDGRSDAVLEALAVREESREEEMLRVELDEVLGVTVWVRDCVRVQV